MGLSSSEGESEGLEEFLISFTGGRWVENGWWSNGYGLCLPVTLLGCPLSLPLIPGTFGKPWLVWGPSMSVCVWGAHIFSRSQQIARSG